MTPFSTFILWNFAVLVLRLKQIQSEQSIRRHTRGTRVRAAFGFSLTTTTSL